MDYLQTLNDAQLQAVLQTEGAVMVLAGAGSGKTRVLTHRITYLLKEKNVFPYNILAITFTNKAANEMRERIAQISTAAKNVWVSTFHSTCGKILRFDIDKLPPINGLSYNSNFTIYSESEVNTLLGKIYESFTDFPENLKKAARYHISSAKNSNNSIERYLRDNAVENADEIAKMYYKYQESLLANNALDFDDMMIKVLELFTLRPDVLKRYQDRFMYVHIDEFQDTNSVQYELIKMLAGGYKNIFAVGDEDQSIYGWRGANINNILNFKKDFEGSKILKLEQNYRSTGHILKAANKLIANNKLRIGKNLFTDAGDGLKIEYRYIERDREEAEFVADNIYALVKNGGGKYEYKDIAILIRLNALSRNFEQRLSSYNIPFAVYGGLKFYDRKEIKDLVAYLLLICNNRDNISLRRIINLPKRNIGETSLNYLDVFATANNMCMYDAIAYLDASSGINKPTIGRMQDFKSLIDSFISASTIIPTFEMVKTVIEGVNFNRVYSSETEEDVNRRMNIAEFLSFVKEETENNPELKLSEFLQQVSLLSDMDDGGKDGNCVKISTVHSAKGLEFKIVFMAGLEEGNFPSYRALDSANEMEEERRICYVAITRARERLYVTHCGSRFKYNRYEYNSVSRFIAEMSDTPPIPQREAFVGHNKHAETHAGSKFSGASTITSSIVQNKSLASNYAIGEKVEHVRFGKGTIVTIENGNIATIAFEQMGIKKLNIDIAPLTKL